MHLSKSRCCIVSKAVSSALVNHRPGRSARAVVAAKLGVELDRMREALVQIADAALGGGLGALELVANAPERDRRLMQRREQAV
jgi:hypothetical protein